MAYCVGDLTSDAETETRGKVTLVHNVVMRIDPPYPFNDIRMPQPAQPDRSSQECRWLTGEPSAML